jgi:type IV pilus assembly protein PilC
VYAESGSQLPVATQVLIGLTGFLKRYFLIFLGIVVISLILFRRWSTTVSGRFLIDSALLRIPFFGNLILKYSVSGFTRTFATVLGSGIPVIESLRMSIGTLNNKLLERKMLVAVTRVEEGISLSAAVGSAGIMPPLALRMLAVGETTGSLEEMLADVSEFFEEDVNNGLHLLTTAIEPAIMLFMGLVIGAIVLAMYLPIFRIASTVG